jgi:hypothetical protein
MVCLFQIITTRNSCWKSTRSMLYKCAFDLCIVSLTYLWARSQSFSNLSLHDSNHNEFYALSAWVAKETFDHLNLLSAKRDIAEHHPSTGFMAVIAGFGLPFVLESSRVH